MGWLDRLAHRREPEADVATQMAAALDADGIADVERRAAAPLPEVAP